MAWKMMLASAVAMAARSVPYAALKPTGQTFVAHASDDMVLKSTPINPDWIISGNPQARTAEHSRGHDEAALTAIWDCTAGEFRWRFGWDETVMILEGEVRVTTDREHIVQVRGILTKRVGAAIAQTAYLDRTPALPPRVEQPAAVIRERGSGRPTKRDRRELERLRGRR